MHRSAFALALVALFSASAQAAVVFSLPQSAFVQIPVVDYFGPGPQAFTGGVWTSTNDSRQGGAVFGYTSGYGYGGNGFWTGALGPMAGVNSSQDVYGVNDSMTFAFTNPVSIIGGFVNYVPGSNVPTTMAVYDANMNLLDSYNLTFLTPPVPDAGQTIGFDMGAPVISYLVLTGNYIGIAGFQGNNAIPEPGTMALMGLGLVAAIAAKRIRG